MYWFSWENKRVPQPKNAGKGLALHAESHAFVQHALDIGPAFWGDAGLH